MRRENETPSRTPFITTLTSLIFHKDLLVFLLITVCSLGAMFNVYRIGAEPVWDGAVYHHLVQEYLQGGSSFKAVNGDSIGSNQITLSYLNRPLFIFVAAGIHNLTGLALLRIYPLMNLAFLTVGAFYLYKTCNILHHISTIPAIIAGCWLLISPPVLVIHQIVASPEPLALCFIACSYYYFGLRRYLPAYAALLLALLSKPSSIALAVYFLVQLLYELRQAGDSSRILENIGILAAVSLFGLLLPSVLINHGAAAFDSKAIVEQIIPANYGHIFMNLLFNCGVLWIPFAAYLPFTGSAYRTGLVYVVLVTGVLATIGATDWMRVWFSILFIFVLPGAAEAVGILCNKSQAITMIAMVALSIIILQAQPLLDLDKVYLPNKTIYMGAAAVLLLSAMSARVVDFLKKLNSDSVPLRERRESDDR